VTRQDAPLRLHGHLWQQFDLFLDCSVGLDEARSQGTVTPRDNTHCDLSPQTRRGTHSINGRLDNLSAGGSAAVVPVDDSRIGCTDGSIGQGSGGDGNSAEASRAEKEQEEGGVCKSSQPYAAELVQIPVSHRGSQTSASFFLTTTNSATSAQRHRGFRPNDSALEDLSRSRGPRDLLTVSVLALDTAPPGNRG
jgi:hypothetical protein